MKSKTLKPAMHPHLTLEFIPLLNYGNPQIFNSLKELEDYFKGFSFCRGYAQMDKINNIIFVSGNDQAGALVLANANSNHQSSNNIDDLFDAHSFIDIYDDCLSGDGICKLVDADFNILDNAESAKIISYYEEQGCFANRPSDPYARLDFITTYPFVLWCNR